MGEAQGQIGTLLGILGSPSRPGELFKQSRKTAKEKEKANHQFVFDSRTVLAPVDAAFEEFFAFPKGQTFGEILQSKDARSRFAARRFGSREFRPWCKATSSGTWSPIRTQRPQQVAPSLRRTPMRASSGSPTQAIFWC